MSLTERVVVKMTPKEKKELNLLAEANASGNASELVRSLIRRAMLFPGEFGLLNPEDFHGALAEMSVN